MTTTMPTAGTYNATVELLDPNGERYTVDPYADPSCVVYRNGAVFTPTSVVTTQVGSDQVYKLAIAYTGLTIGDRIVIVPYVEMIEGQVIRLERINAMVTYASGHTVSMAANTITATAIASSAITSAKIAASAIGATQIATDAITAAKIATDAITAAKIAADAIGASELAADAGTEIAAAVKTAMEQAGSKLTLMKADLDDGGRLDLLIDAIKLVTDALPNSGALTTILENLAYLLTVQQGQISNSQTTAEVYNDTVDGTAYRVTFAGLDADGNRTGVTRSKP